MLQPMEEMILPPKRQAVVDRLRRRIETYRRRQSECVPRFDQSFSGACEQQNLETSALQKRFLEAKTKRQVKKSDRKPDLPAISGNLHSSVHVQQKFGCGDYEPPAKLQCSGGAGGGGGAGEALTKFSVEIVQQLEFTTSAADSQPQQISTNVTVKALANAHVKTSGSPPPAQQPPRMPSPLDCDRECKTECKSEAADDEYVGLDECARALERDAASAFPGLADLIGEDDGDETIEDLITEISEYPEFMKDFDFDGGKMNGGIGAIEPPEGETAPRAYGGSGGGGGEMSPAAQTLKHMAEQHQQATGGDWRYRGAYANYRPRAPPGPAPPPPQPAMDHLHMSQQQQLHLSQPHHNLQVSAAQHMQASVGGNHVSVAAQQGMYASFQHSTPSPQHHQGSGCDTYSVSQSQSINFSQMRARPQGAPPGAQQPGGQPLGVVAAGLSREQQAKMLQQQQQQMLRAQHAMRPPPPEYKARFAGGVAPPGAAGNAGGRRAPTGAPPRAFPPHARQYSPEWRHVLMQQPNTHQFPHHHQGFAMGGMGGMSQQQQQMQLQQARLQQQLMQHQQQRSSQQSPMSHLIMNQNQMMSVQGQMPNIHMSQSQNMSMSGMGGGGMHGGGGGGGGAGSMPPNMHGMGGGGMMGQGGMPPNMSQPGMQNQGQNMQNQGQSMQNQNQSMQNANQSMQNQSQSMQNQNQSMQNQSQSMQSQGESFPSLHAHAHAHAHGAGGAFPAHGDFNLDFLDNMPASDVSAQDLLNSLDNSFLNDIL